ncbi:SDR family NAD(P)-dependent oxidoreductase [Psychrobacter sp. DAB_AL32B]|uniref:SDR family NAD(P)-dependent oxidoreductase n=1 Tax=Psychrobacter sp. DAB_AL32B TaxID=1028414 RepID=UPI000B7D04EE|nr:SDR family oxidoreductase [Psychrobacter sp. DAB_AL32B]OXL17750.1 3-oxoacyl-ACP reductase [Psychrobacter sp. DAB_AL32B]
MQLPTTPSFNLTGKRALVTGASSGIGLGCAVALAEAGAEVTLAARSSDKLQAVVKLMKDKGLKANALKLDITDVAAVRHLFKNVSDAEAFDIVVNSAGMAKHSPALETEPDDFDEVSDINLRASYFLMQAAAKQLIGANKAGSLINISSQMGHVGGFDRAVYCATKHAVEGYTKAMAIEWGKHGIRINTICPTFVKTALSASTFADSSKSQWIMNKIHLGRVAEVEDIMGATVFLASEASAMITGTSLLIDGGWTAE